jgi:glycosyltransferase involved in cell wall biosynthesis
VLREYVANSPQHEFTLYTRQPESPGLMSLDPRVEVRRFDPLPEGSRLERLRTIWELPRRGAELAHEIDAGAHDVVFAQPSFLVQAPEILPFLRTPSAYYAPEPLRIAYEPVPDFGGERGRRARVAERGLDPYERRRRALDRRNIRAAGKVVTHSHFTARALRDIYGVEAAVVPLGVDAEEFTPGEGERDGYVLSVGALHPLKGHQFVIEALATLPAPRPPLVIVGDRGGSEAALSSLAQRLEVEVRTMQGIPFEELLELYRRASALACGQIREPFGLITLEGMATGTPVVAVREGGLEETIDDGRTGLLTDRDPKAFAEALARVISDPDLARGLSAAGLEEARRWTWARTAAGFDRVLESAIEADSSPARRTRRSPARPQSS